MPPASLNELIRSPIMLLVLYNSSDSICLVMFHHVLQATVFLEHFTHPWCTRSMTTVVILHSATGCHYIFTY